MSDEEDYMSDKFLLSCEKDTTSSLIHRRADRREFELEKKRTDLKDKTKSNKVVEHEKREEGLSSAISSNNKGFAMLMKMGYKPGQGIGKDESGIVEPISITVKADKNGLGKTLIKNTLAKRSVNEKLEHVNMKDFRERLAQKKLEQSINSDLFKSQKVCEQLDSQNSKEALEKWFWPSVVKTKEIEDAKNVGDTENQDEEEDSEDDELLSSSEKLEILTKYLRETYCYCIWCGIKYNDDDDLTDSCPGATREDH
ncbi:G patch domain-containing protein 11 [Prorops nasuta]|uniref:G patch domain-containing protein 11 n=1 Tax=Prorops nasuta TaxID=863751 RepID=UPI0034CDAD07